MKDFNTYLKSTELSSKFACELGLKGGFVNFRNSGARGGIKEFTVSLSSLLQGLYDIKSNIAHFSGLTSYVEKGWRDAGSHYFQDLVLNSMITVQTKPCFTTLSKVISWANNEREVDYNDNEIDLSVSSLEQAITHLEALIVKYSPYSNPTVEVSNIRKVEEIKSTQIRDFAYQVFSILFRDNLSSIELIMSEKGEDNKVDLPFLPKVFILTDTELQEDTLSTGQANTLRFFTRPLILETSYAYISTQWYGDERVGLSFQSLKQFLHKHFPHYEISKKDGEYTLISCSKNQVITNKLPKPFLLLAGISGTGKTRFVREQAKATGCLSETYCLTSVRPDWHEPSDLLGYVSRLGNRPQYVATDVLRFIVKAWREIIKKIEKDDNGHALDWRGRELDDIRPFWLCLDEMNLAPVEQYFADYLSVLETRCWNEPDKLQESGLSYVYECEPLIKGEVFTSLDVDISGEANNDSDKPSTQLAKDLGFDLTKPLDKDIWDYFLMHGISIPFNLIVAGTVNMDETTHGFSRKVIDRALSVDFGEFFPNNIDEFFEPKTEPKKLSFPLNSHAKHEQFHSIAADPDAAKTKAFFKAINEVLLGTPFELAFRAFNELCLSVISFTPETGEELDAVFDDFLMCKVLPRIEGDEDKLTTRKGEALLQQLTETLSEALKTIWDSERVDLLRENKGSVEKVIKVRCRSKLKLEYMLSKLDSGFTSFWP
ncbi:McrB family protein [Shewanella sp. WPAGA9]|uniref:McrB family protein n=1 Tax=Shewanella sp. ENK2 TaxID=2775245 RepID=UPI001CDC98F8|nr:restriction endonuclease [Shewanella sp. WPAGA9]